MQQNKNNRGSALVLAIGLLALFSMLALGYIRSSSITLDGADYRVREIRAAEIATAGVNAGIGELQKVVREGRKSDALGTLNVALPTYGAIKEAGEAVQLEPLDNRKAEAVVALSDESGRVNLNHAPASVLQAVLGVDGATARAITASLPSAGGPDGKWLATPEDLLARKLLTPEQFAKVDRSLITTFTVADHARPEKYLNVNQASPKTLAALFGVPLEVAQQAYDKRPYTTLDGLLGALGKLPPAPAPAAPADPSQPAAAPAPPAEPPVPAAVTNALTFDSRCFRIASHGTYTNSKALYSGPQTHGHVDAVVSFDDNGNYTIVYWAQDNAAPEQTADAASAAEKHL